MKKLTTIIGILMLLLISCETATETQKEYEHHCLGPISYFQDGVYWWHLETWMAYNTMDWNDNIEYGVLQEAWHLDTLWQVRTVGFIESDTVITSFNEADDNDLTEVILSEIDKVLYQLRIKSGQFSAFSTQQKNKEKCKNLTPTLSDWRGSS